MTSIRRFTQLYILSTTRSYSMERNIMQCTRSLSQCIRSISHRPIAPTTSIHATSKQSPPRCHRASIRYIHTSRPMLMQSKPPKSRDRGPKSDEDTQTDFSALDVLRNTVAPATSIDACTSDGFALNNQVRISGSGVLLIGGEAFRWWPWAKDGSANDRSVMAGKLLNGKGQWEVQQESWGVLELVYPKPGKMIDM
jgi:NADH dehydrogenase [ubiquinone] 1 alpha subcomplex assembly factor 3